MELDGEPGGETDLGEELGDLVCDRRDHLSVPTCLGGSDGARERGPERAECRVRSPFSSLDDTNVMFSS